MAFCVPLKQISIRRRSTSSGTPAERRDTVHDQERAEFIGDLAKGSDLRHHAGRGFPVRQADELDLAALPGAAHIFRIHGTAKRRGDAVNLGTGALGDIRHATGKHAVHADDRFVTRLQGVDHGCFDAAGSGCGNREGDVVLRLENAAHQLLNAAHELGEPGIDMAHHRRGQRAVNARADARRAGREHQPRRRPQFLHRIHHDFKPQLSWLYAGTPKRSATRELRRPANRATGKSACPECVPGPYSEICS